MSALRVVLLLMMLGGPLLAPLPVLAGPQPDEILEDAGLEARARVISGGLRCLVCRNESIDESNADLARDMRFLVRERLVAGDTDAQVVAFVVERYGEYVLLRPTARGANLMLWLSAPLMLLLALLGAWAYLRQRSAAPEAGPEALSSEERARLDALLREER